MLPVPPLSTTLSGSLHRMNIRITLFALIILPLPLIAAEQSDKPSLEQYLKESVATREDVEKSIKTSHRWKFDGELGVVDGEYVGEVGGLPGGIDGSFNVGTFQADGARKSFIYSDQKPRINTYGDSFTHGDQVNDGETWQEYLAAHLREPIGNFGVGGYGVYQAYRRMLREENTDHAAKYLILTICCDDSTRTLFRSWFPITRTLEHRVFAGAKPNIEIDLGSGRFVEKESLLPTESSLFNLTNPTWMVENLQDDLALQLQLYGGGWWVNEQRIRDVDHKKITRLATLLHFDMDWRPETTTDLVPSKYAAYGMPPITRMQQQCLELLNKYAQAATIYILDKARAFADQKGKKLMVILVLNTDGNMLSKTGVRDNQDVIDHLQKEHFYYFDIDQALVDDYRKANTTLTYSEYVKKYLVNGQGHLNALGNHFFAYAIKDKVIQWLDPKPRTYEKQRDVQLEKEYFFNARPPSN